MSGVAQLSVPQGVPSTVAPMGSLPEVPVVHLPSAQTSPGIPPRPPATQSPLPSTGQPVMMTNVTQTGPMSSSPPFAMPPASPQTPLAFPGTQSLPPNAGQLPTLSSPSLAMPPASPSTPMTFPATQSLPPNAGQFPTSSSPQLAMPPASPPTPIRFPATQSLPSNAGQLPTSSSPPLAMPPASPPTPMRFPVTQSLPPNAGQLPASSSPPLAMPPASPPTPMRYPATQSLPPNAGQLPTSSSPPLAMPPASPPRPTRYPATQSLPPNAGQFVTLSSPPVATPPPSPPTPMTFPATQSLPPNAGQLSTLSSPPLATPPPSPPTPFTVPATQFLPPNACQPPTLSSPPSAVPPTTPPPTPLTFASTQSSPPNAGQLAVTSIAARPPQAAPQIAGQPGVATMVPQLPQTASLPPTACQPGVATMLPTPPQAVPPMFQSSHSPPSTTKYSGVVSTVPQLQPTIGTHAKPTYVPPPQPPLKSANSAVVYKAPDGLQPETFGSKRVSGYSTALEMFPVLFTIFCFVIYIIPIWLTYQIGKDDQVQRWITRFCWVVLLLPLLYLFTHVYHVLKGVPNKILVVTCLLGSSVFLLVLGDTVLLGAYYRGSEFAAQDCLSFPAKHGMEIQFQNAKTYYANCVNAISNQTGVSIPAGVSLYRITDCMNYNYQVKNNPDWPYLQRLEETYRCGGWCSPGQPLWTFQFTKDSCSRAVADTLRYKVKWSMLQVVVYSLVTLGLACSILLLLPSLLQQQGLEW